MAVHDAYVICSVIPSVDTGRWTYADAHVEQQCVTEQSADRSRESVLKSPDRSIVSSTVDTLELEFASTPCFSCNWRVGSTAHRFRGFPRPRFQTGVCLFVPLLGDKAWGIRFRIAPMSLGGTFIVRDVTSMLIPCMMPRTFFPNRRQRLQCLVIRK